MNHLAYVAYGSNVGNKHLAISSALDCIEALDETHIFSNSSLYASSPWGFSSENNFLNGVCLIETNLSVFSLLRALQEIEIDLGKKSNNNDVFEDRIIDLDIISYDLLVTNSLDLTIPHEFAHVRNFVLEPLAEISSDWYHPLYLETAQKLLDRLKNEEPLTKLDAL